MQAAFAGDGKFRVWAQRSRRKETVQEKMK